MWQGFYTIDRGCNLALTKISVKHLVTATIVQREIETVLMYVAFKFTSSIERREFFLPQDLSSRLYADYTLLS